MPRKPHDAEYAKKPVPRKAAGKKLDALSAFYSGSGADSEGRTLDEILTWNDDRLEGCHDYIQWLFPTDRPSAVNPDAPLVTAKDRAAFAHQPTLRENLLRSLRRMLAFYGLRCAAGQGGVRVIRSARWKSRKACWVTANNHNHLRLTRILTSLRLLGLPEYTEALLVALDRLCHSNGGGAISETTYALWRSAVPKRRLRA